MDIKVARVILSKLVGESDSIPAVEAMVSIFKALDEPVQQSTNSDYTAALREGLMQFLEDESPVLFEDIDFSKLATRLNSAIKASQNCA